MEEKITLRMVFELVRKLNKEQRRKLYYILYGVLYVNKKCRRSFSLRQ